MHEHRTCSQEKNNLSSLVTVIIRSIGERTESICNATIEKQISSENILLVKAIPFTETLRQTFEAGLNEKRKWTLCVDSDVLLRPNFIEEFIDYAETCPENVVAFNALALDKFLVSPRAVGIRLYRTSIFERALTYISASQEKIRPETFIIDSILKEGFKQEHTDIIAGLHDFEQRYVDIFRKIFVHTRKHNDRGIAADFRSWKEKQHYDDDFKVAVNAYNISKKYKGNITIDANSEFMFYYKKVMQDLSLKEKCDVSIEDISINELLFMISFNYACSEKNNQKNNPSLYRRLLSKSDNKKLRRRVFQIRINRKRIFIKLFGIKFYEK